MPVLIPAIDSVNALAAARYVAREAARGERPEVLLLHVRARLPLLAQACLSGKPPSAVHHASASSELLEARLVLGRAGIAHTLRLANGAKADAILRAAEETGADRIVLGTARHGSATKLSEAPVVHRLLEASPVPVIVVAGGDVSRLERFAIALGLGAVMGMLLLQA
jgi:nucleotide-binding universal stress UspA family protein